MKKKKKNMTQIVHMSGIIMYAGLTAHMVVPGVGGMILGLWQGPVHFTDEIWLWWLQWWCNTDSHQKRALSTSGGPKRGGGLQLQRGVMWANERVVSEGVSVGKFEWMDQIYSELKKCWGRENDAERGRACTSVSGEAPLWVQHLTAPMKQLSGSLLNSVLCSHAAPRCDVPDCAGRRGFCVFLEK